MARRTFDTLDAARQLEAAGFGPEMAEAIVGTVAEGHDVLAFKSDLDPIRSNIIVLFWAFGLHLIVTLGILAAVLNG